MIKATNINGYSWSMTLEFQVDKLEAPAGQHNERRHYLPCSRCLTVLPVAWNVVAHHCDECYKEAPCSTK